MTTATTSRNFVTVGHLCSLFRRTHVEIAKAVAELGIEPALWLNGVAYHDGSTIEQLRRHFEAKRAKRS